MRLRLLSGAALAGTMILAVTPASAKTLQEALAEAYEANPTLQAARAQLRATDENVPIQRASALPNLSASAQHTEFIKQNSNSFIAPDRTFSAGLDLTVPIYSGGSVRNGIRAAETRVGAGRADLRGSESTIFNQVVAAYMDVIQNEAIVGLTSSNVEVLSVNLQATSDRFEIGDLTRTDVAQSESRLALARGELRTAQANLLSARERYIQLVGSAPDALQPPPPLPGLPDDVDEAVSFALDHNPDLIATKERATAAGYDVRIAGAGRLPTVQVFSGGSYNNNLGTLGSLGSGFEAVQVTTAAQAGVRATIPIFQGGSVAARQRQAQAQEAVALENIVVAERNTVAQVRSSYASWQAANAIIASTQSAVSAAELSLEGVRAENTVGNRTILEILNAQQELLRTQVDLVAARRNSYVAGFTLLAAMGRAEARDLGLEDDVQLYDPEANYNRVRNIIWDWSRDPAPTTQSTRTVDIPAQDGEIHGP